VPVWLNPFTAHDNYNSKKNPTPEMVAAIQQVLRIKHVGCNKAALAFIAGGNDTKIPL